MIFSRWFRSAFSPSIPARRWRANRLSLVSADVELLEKRLLLSNQNVVTLELPQAPGTDIQDVSYNFQLVGGQATFAEFGVFVFDADGTVDGIAPGQNGFDDAVLNSASRHVLMAGGAPVGSLATTSFAGSGRIGVYFRQNTAPISTGNHIAFQSTSANTLRLGWDATPVIWAAVGVPDPNWFDDAVFQVTEGAPVDRQGPVLTAIADQTIPELKELQLQVQGQNVGGSDDLLRYQLDQAPTGASIDANTGLFTWTPSALQKPATYDVTVRAFDSTQPDKFATRSFTITVTDVNQAQTAHLTLYANGDPVALPVNIGVQSDGSTAQAFTIDSSGNVIFDPIGGVTLGEFFDIWRTNAGLAGNNPDALFNANQLLGNTADATNTVQMFVNGQVSKDFENYVVQAGDQIVLDFGSNPVVSLNTNQGSIVMELFPDSTPITVDNFLNYVNRGDYVNSIFHRSVPGFVVQGGGFTTSSVTFTDTSQFTAITTDPAITNEPGISNTRGTIAMAKVSGDPNSATDQFFVNLAANTSLDSQNGGFTVFGQVLDMTPVDQIAAIPVNTANASPYDQLPVTTDNQLVVIQSIAGLGSLTGVKFLDANQNGVQDTGEAGIANTLIYIDANNNGVHDAGEISTMTDANGQYLLQVTPGTYMVRAEVSTGATQTAPTSPDSYSETVEIGRVIQNLDFGEF